LSALSGHRHYAGAFGDGGEFRSPRAIAVIGGLVVSTVLSLVFVPAAFTVLDDVGRSVWRLVARFVGDKDEPEGGSAIEAVKSRP
jgi:hypothetical protein